MSQFKKTKKIMITAKVDEEDLEEAKKQNLNVSKICREALKAAIKGVFPPKIKSE